MSQSPNLSQSKKKINSPRDDSDGDEMDESDSEKMSSDSNSSDRSDDDSSSDLDASECDRRITENYGLFEDMEKQFEILKDQLFRERCTQVDDKLFEIRSGRAQEYLQPVQQLQESMRIRTEVAAILKQFSIASVQAQIEAEEQAAQQNLQSEQKLLFDLIQEDLENQIRRLEEDRNNIDVSSALWGTEKQPSRGGYRRKPTTVSGPYIIYMVSDADILSDLTVIKKALTASKRKSSVH